MHVRATLEVSQCEKILAHLKGTLAATLHAYMCALIPKISRKGSGQPSTSSIARVPARNVTEDVQYAFELRPRDALWARVAPQHLRSGRLDFSLDLRSNGEAEKVIQGWVQEMWGYSIAAASLGIKHKLVHDFQVTARRTVVVPSSTPRCARWRRRD